MYLGGLVGAFILLAVFDLTQHNQSLSEFHQLRSSLDTATSQRSQNIISFGGSDSPPVHTQHSASSMPLSYTKDRRARPGLRLSKEPSPPSAKAGSCPPARSFSTRQRPPRYRFSYASTSPPSFPSFRSASARSVDQPLCVPRARSPSFG